jgi:hypothetical protein
MEQQTIIIIVVVLILLSSLIGVGIFIATGSDNTPVLQSSGYENDNATFNCPTGKSLTSGTVIYGTLPDKIKTFTIPKGTPNLLINNATMGGDPNPFESKKWDASWSCG